MAKDWNPFWRNDARSEYCQPIRNCTVIYTCRGDWLLCIKWGELNDLKIYLQKGSSRRQDVFLAFLCWKSNHIVLWDLPSIWTYLLFSQLSPAAAVEVQESNTRLHVFSESNCPKALQVLLDSDKKQSVCITVGLALLRFVDRKP